MTPGLVIAMKPVGGIAAETFAQIDAAFIAEAGNRLAVGGIQRVDEIHHADDDAAIFVVGTAQ